MTTELFSKNLLNKILASIPRDFEKSLTVKQNEPNTIQLLKLSIISLFNNVLRSPFFDKYANNTFKALWLLKNIECAQKVFAQYNFLDYYPYIDNGDYIEPFISNRIHVGDIPHQYDVLTLLIPNVMAAITTLKNVQETLKPAVYFRLMQMAETEAKLDKTVSSLAINLMFSIGEYNSTMDRFVDMFLPINRDDELPINREKELARSLDNTRSNEPIFSDKTICLLSRSREGGQVLTILSDSDKNSSRRFHA